MTVAFYAPLKSPAHPNPSGDRQIARLLIAAIQCAGYPVFLASRFRSLERSGDKVRQQALEKTGRSLAHRIVRKIKKGVLPRPIAWLTYHIYHKAPDWIGPEVCAALDIPYLVAEASVSPKQHDGKWISGHQRAIHCIGQADAMIVLNLRDIECALPHAAEHTRLLQLPLFLDTNTIPSPAKRSDQDDIKLISVAMMRPGDKQQSWQFLSRSLNYLPHSGWKLHCVGSGKLERTIVRELESAANGNLIYHGRLEGAELFRLISASDLFVWPAINEAMGMALLEAGACGIPVVAGRNGGVANVVAHGRSGLLCKGDNPESLAAAVRYLMEHKGVRIRMGNDARKIVHDHHSLESAAARLDNLIKQLCRK